MRNIKDIRTTEAGRVTEEELDFLCNEVALLDRAVCGMVQAFAMNATDGELMNKKMDAHSAVLSRVTDRKKARAKQRLRMTINSLIDLVRHARLLRERGYRRLAIDTLNFIAKERRSQI